MKVKLIAFVIIIAFTGCIHFHHDKFGKEYNEERQKLGVPIIKNGWRRDVSIYFPAPENRTLWFTNSGPKENKFPYHAYKAIYYINDTLVAERDTYLNTDHKWFKDGKPDVNSNDTLYKTFAQYHALMVYFVYRQTDSKEKDFSNYSLGFNYEIMGVKNGFSDIQTIDSLTTEEILKGWNLKRLNY
jgi:hypothetical protein